jgi:hypothetical protein
MRHSDVDLERARLIVEDSAGRLAAQEALIERLRAPGHRTEHAEDFLGRMRELHRLQVKLRDDLERLVKEQNSSN